MPDDADASAVTPAAVKRDRGAGEGETTKENDALDVHAEVAGNEEEEDDELEYENRLRRKRSKGGLGASEKCPFLDTVNRNILDFDFEKFCSVSLTNLNVYVCLVCGKYFQGRGPGTHASTHSLECGHHVYMHLANGRTYCLPDGYEVIDSSLADIRYNLNPTYTPKEIAEMDSKARWSRSLDGVEFLPGVLGINNIRMNDYANVIVQALNRVVPLRNFFLQASSQETMKSQLAQRFGELLRKLWNPRAFREHVSPHEFMQSVIKTSNKRFRLDKQSDPVEFLQWFLNTLHSHLGGTRTPGSSVVHKCFQGALEVTDLDKATGTAGHIQTMPFLMLGLDLPPTPLFKDSHEKNIIPQVQLFHILQKFDGETVYEAVNKGRKTYKLSKLPPYLILHMKRFTKNNFFMEKNPTIVTFPVKNLELKDYLPVPTDSNGNPVPSKYNLVANVVHDGKPGEGSYRMQVHHKADESWYEMQDLVVQDMLPQVVALAEAYLQIYELQS